MLPDEGGGGDAAAAACEDASCHGWQSCDRDHGPRERNPNRAVGRYPLHVEQNYRLKGLQHLCARELDDVQQVLQGTLRSEA